MSSLRKLARRIFEATRIDSVDYTPPSAAEIGQITDHAFYHDPQVPWAVNRCQHCGEFDNDHVEPTPHVCQMCERPLEGHWWRCVNPTTEPVLRDAVRALVDDLEGAARGALSTTLPHSRGGAADRARLYRDLAARLAEALAES